MTKINRPIAPSAPKKPVPTTTPTLRDIPTPPTEETLTLGKGQNLVLGLTTSLGSDTVSNWGRQSADKLKDGGTGLFGTNRNKETEVTYDANNDEANEITLGSTGNNLNEDTTTRINLDKNDTLRLASTNTIASVESNDDGTVTVTFEERVNNPNYNPQAPNQMSKWESATHTSIVTMPEDSLENITAGLSSEQKEALGTQDTSTLAQRLGKKDQDDYTGYRDNWRTRASSKKDKTENNGYFNVNDTTPDGIIQYDGKASTRNNKTLNLDDTDAEGNDTGKDVAQSLKIKKLDDSVTKALRLNINLGNKDTIEQLGGTEFVGSESTVGSNSMTLTLEQKNTNGGSRLIKITLPKDNLEKAIENLDPKLKDAILAKGETSQEDPPRRRTQEERPRREERRNQSEEITFGKPTKIPSLDKKTPTYRLDPSSLQLPEFSASDAAASPFFKP